MESGAGIKLGIVGKSRIRGKNKGRESTIQQWESPITKGKEKEGKRPPPLAKE